LAFKEKETQMADTRGLRAAWTAIGAILFYFTVNALARAWQWPLALPGIGFEKTTDPYAAALIAVPTGLVLLALLATCGAAHAARVKRGGVFARMPQPFGLGDSRNLLLHALQIAVFLVVPLFSLVALTRKYFSGQFCARIQTSTQGCGITGASAIGNWSAHFRYVPLGKAIAEHNYVYQGGVDYWPFWMPLIICVLWLLMSAAVGFFVTRLIRPE
jgi:hypothetical protein